MLFTLQKISFKFIKFKGNEAKHNLSESDITFVMSGNKFAMQSTHLSKNQKQDKLSIILINNFNHPQMTQNIY
jgi:hypothetical protein